LLFAFLRIVPLSGSLIDLLRNYYRDYRPEVWLFEGIKKGEKYDERSLQMVLKKSVTLAGIKKPVTLHWLRHSYATHLHECGVDIHMIQLLLGHKNTRTTEIYTHVSNKSIQQVRSPFDDL
jgi:integrase/recombinase XerD